MKRESPEISQNLKAWEEQGILGMSYRKKIELEGIKKKCPLGSENLSTNW